MKASPSVVSSLLVIAIAACGSESSSTPPDKLPDCPSGNCGKESFRRAVPTRAEVRIDRPTGNARIRREPGVKAPVIGRKRGRARAISPALLAVDDQ
jgi:hypothetical protein